jgi:hypothetical protein
MRLPRRDRSAFASRRALAYGPEPVRRIDRMGLAPRPVTLYTRCPSHPTRTQTGRTGHRSAVALASKPRDCLSLATGAWAVHGGGGRGSGGHGCAVRWWRRTPRRRTRWGLPGSRHCCGACGLPVGHRPFALKKKSSLSLIHRADRNSITKIHQTFGIDAPFRPRPAGY